MAPFGHDSVPSSPRQPCAIVQDLFRHGNFGSGRNRYRDHHRHVPLRLSLGQVVSLSKDYDALSALIILSGATLGRLDLLQNGKGPKKKVKEERGNAPFIRRHRRRDGLNRATAFFFLF